MTSVFGPEGESIPCTVIEAGPCVVTQVKNAESDGYRAIQLSFGDKKEKHTNKAEVGHFKKANTTPKRTSVEFRDFRTEFDGKVDLGTEIRIQDVFVEGDWLDAIGTSKGRGFQGVVKRHGFSGVGEATHGQHNRLRAPGSIGAGSDPSRVFKGTRMAGRTGGRRTMVENIKVIKVDTEKNLIVVKGSVPGPKNSYVIITK